MTRKNKAWETSWTRRIIIAIATYVTIISTLTTPVFKRWWLKNVYQRNK
ncbi:MAG: hypothetical protein HY051_04625 [Candidatus Aenigmarchaeota archaeon]|nr:hypothetical protein [Candidatus Aenigmarchaeota archaeon]